MSQKRCINALGLVCLIYATVSGSTVVNATTLTDVATVRAGVNVNGVDFVSYDGRGFDAFQPFSAFTSSELYRFNSFTGDAGGSQLDAYVLSRVAYYDGISDPTRADQFGMIDSGGNFIAMTDPSDGPGQHRTMMQNAGQQFTLGLRSPEGLFSSVDDNNSDHAAHMIGKIVTQAGQIFIPNANLHGASLLFDLQVGDIILFMEDLLVSGNMLYGLNTDADFNDYVLVIRQSSVPEPATAGLLGAALAGLFLKRRKRS